MKSLDNSYILLLISIIFCLISVFVAEYVIGFSYCFYIFEVIIDHFAWIKFKLILLF